ncbi:hypothetical protein LguiA_015548 [Lonicera macranthoides]
MAARTFSTPPIASQYNHKQQNHCFQTLIQKHNSQIFQNPWLGTTKLLIQCSDLRPSLPKPRPIKDTISFSLPTAKPERVASSTGKFPKWSAKAIKAFQMAEVEASKITYTTLGTEALVMGILIEGTSLASNFLRANGIMLMKVREEFEKLFGKVKRTTRLEHPPLTEAAQRALDWAIDEKIKSGDEGEITTSHLLLGVWYQEESPGHKVLAALGFDNEKAKVLQSLISKPGFVED